MKTSIDQFKIWKTFKNWLGQYMGSEDIDLVLATKADFGGIKDTKDVALRVYDLGLKFIELCHVRFICEIIEREYPNGSPDTEEYCFIDKHGTPNWFLYDGRKWQFNQNVLYLWYLRPTDKTPHTTRFPCLKSKTLLVFVKPRKQETAV